MESNLRDLFEALPGLQTGTYLIGFVCFLGALLIYLLGFSKNVKALVLGGSIGLSLVAISQLPELIQWIPEEARAVVSIVFVCVALVLPFLLAWIVVQDEDNDESKPPPGPAPINLEETVRECTVRISLLWGFFEAAFKGNKTDASRVIEEAPQLAQKLEAIDDEELRLWYRILKYYTAGVAYYLAAGVYSQTTDERIKFAQQAVPLLEKALDLTKQAQGKPSDAEATFAAQNSDSKLIVPKTKCFIAICIAIRAKFAASREKEDLENQVARLLQDLKKQHPAYLEKWPPQDNSFLAPYFTSAPERGSR